MRKLLPLLLLILIGCSEPLKDGPYKTYYENGQIEHEGIYEDGKAHGIWKSYYENGQLKSEGIYEDDKAYGIFKSYYENGQLQQEGIYEDGKAHGIWKSYYENGQLKSEGIYKDDIKVGPWLHYDSFGKFEDKVIFSDVEEVILNHKQLPFSQSFQKYYESGELKSEGFLIDGKTNGPLKTYYKSGALKEETMLEDNKPAPFGYFKTYYENGQLAIDSKFDENGLLSGIAKDYDQYGRLMSIYTYLENELIDQEKYTLVQDLSNSFKLTLDMTEGQVIDLLGEPIRVDIDSNIKEWFYCRTGSEDQHLALFFHNGLLISRVDYVVTLEDTGGIGGSCETFIKMGTYYIPEKVNKIRLDNR